MNDTPDTSVAAGAERLKEARARIFESAAEAARALGLKEVTVRAHESGQNGFPVQTAAKYAKAYGITLQWLLSGQGLELSAEPQRFYREPGVAAPVLSLAEIADGRARLTLCVDLPMDVALHIISMVQEARK